MREEPNKGRCPRRRGAAGRPRPSVVAGAAYEMNGVDRGRDETYQGDAAGVGRTARIVDISYI